MTVILLAAGLSSRMGCNKLLLPFNGKALILSTLETVLTYTDKVVVVTGYEHEHIENAVGGYNVRTVYADNYKAGQKYSTLRGIEETDDDFAVVPGDLPLITIDDFKGTEKLLDTYTIARTCHKGIPGHPVMYRKEHREKLLQFDGTMREYLAQNSTGFYEGDIGSIMDADTPERYRMLLEMQKSN